jgi:branched-chain amino acid transport system ATP-binding protein
VTGPPVLELEAVEASYGPFRALFGVTLRVGAGEVLALLGPNGAGKTTVARVATGLVVPTKGAVRVGGEDFTGRRPHRFVRAGVLHAPEGRSIFATLTVEENLRLSLRRSHGAKGVREALAQAYELFPRLGERRNQLGGTLSGGEQRMLSLARVLVERPRLLVADELSLGLAPKVVDEVYETLARVRSQGTAVLVVEQHVGHALALADRVAVLAHGAVAWEGPATEASVAAIAAAAVPAAPAPEPAGGEATRPAG